MQHVFSSCSFDAWEQMLRHTLGEHRSHLSGPGRGFSCSVHSGSAANLRLVLLEGTGQVTLERHQGGGGVLWIPFRGSNLERVNGVEVVAEPGDALLFRPGDVMVGTSAEHCRGLSVALPESLWRCVEPLSPPARPRQPSLLKRSTPGGKAPIAQTLELYQATCNGDQARHQLAYDLQDNLKDLLAPSNTAAPLITIPTARRLELIEAADQWIGEHLATAFSAEDMASGVGVHLRTLQRAYQQELQRTPLEQARLLRLHAARQMLQGKGGAKSATVKACLEEAGLPASGRTASLYKRHFAETPRQTLQNATRANSISSHRAQKDAHEEQTA
jgi:AraC-like DNA-binding protein